MYPCISRFETLTVAQYDECKDAATADELENLGCVVETVVDASGLSGKNIFDPPGFRIQITDSILICSSRGPSTT